MKGLIAVIATLIKISAGKGPEDLFCSKYFINQPADYIAFSHSYPQRTLFSPAFFMSLC